MSAVTNTRRVGNRANVQQTAGVTTLGGKMCLWIQVAIRAPMTLLAVKCNNPNESVNKG